MKASCFDNIAVPYPSSKLQLPNYLQLVNCNTLTPQFNRHKHDVNYNHT